MTHKNPLGKRHCFNGYISWQRTSCRIRWHAVLWVERLRAYIRTKGSRQVSSVL